MVETLKTFHDIILGQRVLVYTDPKNLTYGKFTIEIVLQCAVIIWSR